MCTLLDAHVRIKERSAQLIPLGCMAFRQTHDRPNNKAARCENPRQTRDSPHPGADSVVSAIAGSANVVHVVHDICSNSRGVKLSGTVSSGISTLQAPSTALTIHTINICLCLEQAAGLAHNDGEAVAVALKAIPRCVKIAKGPASKAGSRV